MSRHSPSRHSTIRIAVTALAGASILALSASLAAAQYKMTVNRDRLINAQNEPQNWLMMNGDYGSQRYSKLTQITRDNVKNLRMAWALSLGGMQDVGQNGPENEVNPLIDNGFMYTTDGWGTVYKIDARNANKGEFVWVCDPGVRHEGNVSRTRGIALWEDLVIANLPDGRVIAINRDSGEIVWDKQVAKADEFGSKERFYTAPITAEGKVLVANGAGDGGTRGWLAALDARTGKELWRWYVVPKPGEPGSETWKDKNNAWKTGGGGLWQTGSYDPATHLTIWGTGNPVPQYDPESRPGDNLYTNAAVALDVETGKLVWHYQYTPNDSWDYDENGIHMLYDVTVNGQTRKAIGHFGRNGFFYTLDRANGSFIKGGQYVNDLNWTKGLDPKTGKPIEYDPTLDVQKYQPEARALRGDGMKRACPTWHGGVAHQPTAYDPTTKIAYGVGIEGCFTQNGAKAVFKGPEGGLDTLGEGGVALREQVQPVAGDLDPPVPTVDPRAHRHSLSLSCPRGAVSSPVARGLVSDRSSPTSPSRLTTTTVTLSLPPASTAARTSSSAATWGSGHCCRISRNRSSGISLVRPSLQMTKRSPA